LGEGTLIECFVEDEQYFEVVRSMEEYLSKDKNSKIKEDAECLLNERSGDLMHHKELNNALIFEIVTTQEEFLVKEGDEIQFKELICEATFETVESCDFQIYNLFINVGIISDDEVLMKCHKEIELLEYLL